MFYLVTSILMVIATLILVLTTIFISYIAILEAVLTSLTGMKGEGK